MMGNMTKGCPINEQGLMFLDFQNFPKIFYGILRGGGGESVHYQ